MMSLRMPYKGSVHAVHGKYKFVKTFFSTVCVSLHPASRRVLGVQVGFKKGEEGPSKKRHRGGKVWFAEGMERWKGNSSSLTLRGGFLFLFPGYTAKAVVRL